MRPLSSGLHPLFRDGPVHLSRPRLGHTDTSSLVEKHLVIPPIIYPSCHITIVAATKYNTEG